MSQDACGRTGPIVGGVIKESTIINSQISNSIIQGSEFASGTVTSLVSIDTSSAKVIANAIAGLPAEDLLLLANAIRDAMSSVVTPAPVSSSNDKITREFVGGRDMILGEPTQWAKWDATHSVPLYTTGS